MKKRLASLLALLLTLGLFASPAAALEVEDARDLLQKYYVDEIPEEILSLESLDQILEALNDPYTVYLSAGEYQSFLSSVNGEAVVGIGVSIQTAFDSGFRIMSILPDSPALEAGLEAGDRIVAVECHIDRGFRRPLHDLRFGGHLRHHHRGPPGRRRPEGLHPGPPRRGHPHRHI